MITGGHILGLIGQFAIGFAIIVLAHLSQRLGYVTHARPYFIGQYVAGGFVWLSMLVHFYFIFITQGTESQASSITVWYTLVTDGFQAIGITLGLVVTWYYWSWLLAERD